MGIKGEEKLLTDLKKLVLDTLRKAMPNGKFEKLPYSTKIQKGNLPPMDLLLQGLTIWEMSLRSPTIISLISMRSIPYVNSLLSTYCKNSPESWAFGLCSYIWAQGRKIRIGN